MNVRKLAAIDLHFLGPAVILTEFAAGVVGPLTLGALTLRMASRHSWGVGLTLFGGYLLSLGINYVPLLLNAISLVRTHATISVIGDEVVLDRRAAMRKYRRQSLFLLVPFVVPVFAVVQRQKEHKVRTAV